MKHATLIFPMMLCAAVIPAAFADEYEQITLHNTTPFQVTMNVDGHYGCTANANVDCTSAHENISAHNLVAIYQGQIVGQKAIPPMTRFTFVVCYGDYPRLHGGACPGAD
jgi:hypothetical protein